MQLNTTPSYPPLHKGEESATKNYDTTLSRRKKVWKSAVHLPAVVRFGIIRTLELVSLAVGEVGDAD
jgi:hypothetical protein